MGACTSLAKEGEQEPEEDPPDDASDETSSVVSSSAATRTPSPSPPRPYADAIVVYIDSLLVLANQQRRGNGRCLACTVEVTCEDVDSGRVRGVQACWPTHDVVPGNMTHVGKPRSLQCLRRPGAMLRATVWVKKDENNRRDRDRSPMVNGDQDRDESAASPLRRASGTLLLDPVPYELFEERKIILFTDGIEANAAVPASGVPFAKSDSKSLNHRLLHGQRFGELSIQFLPPPPRRKYCFMVRHAESEWNEAQRNKNIINMLRQVDHPLTAAGCEQVMQLQRKVARWSKVLEQEQVLRSRRAKEATLRAQRAAKAAREAAAMEEHAKQRASERAAVKEAIIAKPVSPAPVATRSRWSLSLVPSSRRFSQRPKGVPASPISALTTTFEEPNQKAARFANSFGQEAEIARSLEGATLSPPQKNEELVLASTVTPPKEVVNDGIFEVSCPQLCGKLRAFKTQLDGYSCSRCEDIVRIGHKLWGCRNCNYDLCKDCWVMEVESLRARAGTKEARSDTVENDEDESNDALHPDTAGALLTALRGQRQRAIEAGELDVAAELSKDIKHAKVIVRAHSSGKYSGQVKSTSVISFHTGDAASVAVSHLERRFMHAHLYSSPLCRALQTALLAFGPSRHPGVRNRGIGLLSEAREVKKSRGSLDSSANVVGDEIRQRAINLLAPPLPRTGPDATFEGASEDVQAVCFGDESARGGGKRHNRRNRNRRGAHRNGAGLSREDGDSGAIANTIEFDSGMSVTELRAALETVSVQSGDAGNEGTRWWTTGSESSADSKARIANFMEHLRLLPTEDLTVVCHSHFIREIFREYSNPNFEARTAVVAECCENKLENAGVVALHCDFGPLFDGYREDVEADHNRSYIDNNNRYDNDEDDWHPGFVIQDAVYIFGSACIP